MLAMRTIYFMAEFNNSEKDRSGNTSLRLGYQQTDFDFHSFVWDALKEDSKNAVDTWGGKNTKKILEIIV